jgi:hypothetical protein
VLDPAFLISQASNLRLPTEKGSHGWVLDAFSNSYRNRDKHYYRAKSALYDAKVPEGLGIGAIWKGRRASDAPVLTVYRHFDSASVHKGVLGDLPRTMWLIDYPHFERIYYSLVAGFDVFGDVTHQLNIRRYMDYLRAEGELNFVEFLPRDVRFETVQSWYIGNRAAEKLKPDQILSNRETGIVYETDDPKRELVERVVEHHILQETGIEFDDVNYHRTGVEISMPTEFNTHEDILNGFRALTAPGTNLIMHYNESDVNVIFVRVRDFEGEDHFITVVVNRWHDNVNALFGEEKRLDASKDTLDFIVGSVGSYPNRFLDLRGDEVPDLFDLIENFDGSPAYLAKVAKYSVDRDDADFWELYDWFQQRMNEADPLTAGLYDLSRYRAAAGPAEPSP